MTVSEKRCQFQTIFDHLLKERSITTEGGLFLYLCKYGNILYIKTHGKVVGPLHGLPISVKENLNILGTDSTLGFASRCFELAGIFTSQYSFH